MHTRLRTLASSHAALQHEPRPLPIFLNLLIEHAGNDAALVRRVLAGVDAYRTAERAPRPPEMPEIARVGRVRLLDYGSSGQPVLFVPSLINPPYVLDLAPDNSLLRWLATQHVRPLLVDWGDPRDGDETLSVSDHVTQRLLPLLDTLGETPVLAGYCLGGTMAIAAASLRTVRAVLTIAAPWRFDGFPNEARERLSGLWAENRPLAETLGLFPMELLQNAFWRLDPCRTITKYAEFGEMEPDSPQAKGFVVLEDWANDGPPLTLAAAEELLVDMFGSNRPGTGQWMIGERRIDPAALACPLFNIVSQRDRIVPAASAPPAGAQRILDQGHVGMVVGRQAPQGLWRIVAEWLARLP